MKERTEERAQGRARERVQERAEESHTRIEHREGRDHSISCGGLRARLASDAIIRIVKQ